MATIGRNHAVAEIGGRKFGGFAAWVLWLVVHLRSILVVKNKAFILLNWVWNYLNYKQSLRLILKAKDSRMLCRMIGRPDRKQKDKKQASYSQQPPSRPLPYREKNEKGCCG